MPARRFAAAATRKVRFLIASLRAFGTVMYVFTLGMKSSRNRVFIRETIPRLSPFRPGATIPAIAMNPLLEGATLTLTELPGQDGNITMEELMTITALARSARKIFEIGTYDGTWYGVTDALNELYRDVPAFKGLRRVDGTKLVLLPGAKAQSGPNGRARSAGRRVAAARARIRTRGC